MTRAGFWVRKQSHRPKDLFCLSFLRVDLLRRFSKDGEQAFSLYGIESHRFLGGCYELLPKSSSHAYWGTGQKDPVWTTVRQTVEANQRGRQAHYLLGEIAAEKGEKALAQREFSTAASLSEA